MDALIIRLQTIQSLALKCGSQSLFLQIYKCCSIDYFIDMIDPDPISHMKFS